MGKKEEGDVDKNEEVDVVRNEEVDVDRDVNGDEETAVYRPLLSSSHDMDDEKGKDEEAVMDENRDEEKNLLTALSCD